MPPQKPVGNVYYQYEDISGSNGMPPENAAMDDPLHPSPNEQNSTNGDNDFSEYLWMENEEEFDKEVLEKLQEEELMEQCLEAMLEDEHTNLMADRMYMNNTQSYEGSVDQDILNIVNNFKLDLVEKSTLNPLAAEFVPDTKALPHTRNTKRE